MKSNLFLILSGVFVLAGCCSTVPYALKQRDGQSRYAILRDDTPYARFAASELARILQASSGVQLPVFVKGKEAIPPPYQKIILTHTSPSPTEQLAEGESLVTAKKGDILIAGENRSLIDGTFLFLEREAGYRDFLPEPEGECIPPHTNLTFSGQTYREKPAFSFYRRLYMIYLYGKDAPIFQLRNRGEIRYTSQTNSPLAELSETFPCRDSGHGFRLYITPERTRDYYPWDEPKDYFKTNPEFFSLDQNGKRTDQLQLCFSNPALRQELLKRFLERSRRVGGRGTLMFGANDWPGAFCYCPACQKLTERYGCKAGPLLDCLQEVLPPLKKAYPNIRVSVLAYRKQQTEFPPHNITSLPDNFICDFAPVDDDQGQYLDGPRNLGTVSNLTAWARLTPNLTYWYYSCIQTAPYGIVSRLAHDLKIIHSAGVKGIGICGLGSPGLFPLQEYLFLRLTVHPEQDPQALVKEYTDFLYGAAAPEMRTYIREVDEVWAANRIPRELDARAETLLDFTPERLIRWQAMFDRMEQKIRGDARAEKMVARARIDVDYLCLVHDGRIRKAFPAWPMSAKAIHDRLLAAPVQAWYKCSPPFSEIVETAYRRILAAGKPIPQPLASIPPDRIIQIPTCGGDGNRTDPDAACGMAQSLALEGQAWGQTKKIVAYVYDIATKKTVASGKIDVAQAKPNQYALYRLCESTIPRSGLLALDNWLIGVSLAPYYPEGDEFHKFEIWASLKFTGPVFDPASHEGETRMFCDRVFLIRR